MKIVRNMPTLPYIIQCYVFSDNEQKVCFRLEDTTI